MGRGIIHPVDNMSKNNDASHPELLDELTAALVVHKFDLKWYIRELVNSQTYRLSSSGPVEKALPRQFERARTRPLTAEELLDSWNVATGYKAIEQASGAKTSTDRYGIWLLDEVLRQSQQWRRQFSRRSSRTFVYEQRWDRQAVEFSQRRAIR